MTLVETPTTDERPTNERTPLVGGFEPGDSERGRELGLRSGEARRRKAERTDQEIAASALKAILLRLESGEIPVDGRNVAGVVRALSDVTGQVRAPDTGQLASEILTRIKQLNGATPRTENVTPLRTEG